MSSREDILQNIRRNTRTRYERPDLTSLEEEALTAGRGSFDLCGSGWPIL